MQKEQAPLQSKKVGIVLLNMGGPKDLEAVRPFLFNLFADGDIINLPLLIKPFQKQIALLIAKIRTPSTSKMYEQIGGGSPILPITEDLGNKLIEQLNTSKTNFVSAVAMRYTKPGSEDAVKKLINENVTDVILFSQYPHFADSTSGSSLRDFYAAVNKYDYYPDSITEIDEWGTEPEYLEWWISGIKEKLEGLSVPLNKNVHLIFSAHGLPKRYIDRGETYPDRVKDAVDLIVNDLGEIADQISIHLSFQSQAGPIEWTKPYTDELLKEIADNNGKAVIIVPIGFVSNHVETLYEIDILYKNQALEAGIEIYERVEVPDANENYAEMIANLVRRRWEESI